MFAISKLSKFESEKTTFKILKPWWDVITDYLVMFLLTVPIVIGGMEAVSGSFDCLPAVDCPMPKNDTLSNVCATFYSSQKATDEKRMSVVTDINNHLQYANYVNSECSKSAVHWFLSYFSLFLLGQALILLILDNFWLKIPTTASIIETFSALVMECDNSPGTNFVLSQMLHNLPPDLTNNRSDQDMHNFSEKEVLLNEQQDNDQLSFTASSINEGKVSVDDATIVAAKTLYEKVKQFEKSIISSHMIWTLYLLQAVLQALLTVVFIIIDSVYMTNLKGTMKCSVRQHIPVVHDYFICSHSLAPVFETGLYVFLLLLSLSFVMFSYISVWTFQKVFLKKQYDFENDLQSQILDIEPAKADMNFLLQLLHAYNKLYVDRFAIYMSEASEKKVKAYSLARKWPVSKLKEHCENNGRKLSLNRLDGIPQTIFSLPSLIVTLELTRCSPPQDDDFEQFKKLFNLRKLVIVDCSLTKISEKVLELTSLEELILKHNSIEEIQDGISALVNLTTIDLSFNELISISKNIEELENLFKVDLSNNEKLDMNAIKIILACKSLRILEPPAGVTEEQLNNEETIKFRKVTSAAKKAYVIPYTPEDAPRIDTSNRERLYKMDSSPKGVAVIINILSIPGSTFAHRLGSGKDVSALNNLFEQIGFKTVTFSNCTASETKEILRRYTMDESYEKCDSIIVAIMAHGSENGLVFHDNEVVAVNDLVTIVQGSPHYDGKPKIFFIQACRGVRMATAHQRCTKLSMPGYACCVDNTTDSFPPLNKKKALPTTAVPARETLAIFEPPIPQGADVLLSFSTLPGHTSLRSTRSGGWFVNVLVDVFSKHAWEEDILSLLTLVNYKVARLISATGWRQIPSPQSTLTKKLYLLPGYPKRQNSPNTARHLHVNQERKTYL